MIAQKVLSKFFGWVRHSPPVLREQMIAEQEFLGLRPVDRLREELAQGLFLDWFWFERPLTSTMCSPVSLFRQERRKTCSESEYPALAAMEKTIFSLYEVLETRPAEDRLLLRDCMRGVKWMLHEHAGSRSSSSGDILIARVIPVEPLALMTGWAAHFPAKIEEFERNKKDYFKDHKMPFMRPRDALNLFVEPVDWDSKGAAFVRAKLSGLWQRWSPGITFREVERIVGEERMERLMDIQKAFLERCPADEDREKAMELLMSYWNWHAGTRIGKEPPAERGGAMGPVERDLGRRMSLFGMARLRETGRVLTSEEVRAWYGDPHNGKDGKSPMQMIQDERRAAGEQAPENMNVHVFGGEIDDITPGEREGDRLWRAGNDAMVQHRFKEAIEKLEAAYELLRHREGINFRVLGNLGLAYAILGRKEDAENALQGALTHNPDYDLARRTLSRLQSMNRWEFERFRREAPSQLTKTEWSPDRKDPEEDKNA